ncbi:MAG: branched-chain amino acid ABC transporter substrate-binding protein [Intrasporangium sp.]|uniref:branched-chain amino acid ABC transporter substrate-binding protein n=1 Tax=Intrasporangium sp. TaxID=1925024 RepID=UPI003F80E2E5
MSHLPARRRSRPILGAGILVAALSLTACSDAPSTPDAPRAPITFGVLAPLTGTEAARGQDLADGARMAERDLNARGGVIGRHVSVTVEDDACTDAGARDAVGKLVAVKVAGIVGTVCDDAAKGAIKAVAPAGLPLLVSSAHGEDVVSEDAGAAYLMDSTPYQAALATVHWLSYLDAQRLAVISSRAAEAESLADRVSQLASPVPKLVTRQHWDTAAAGLATVVDVALKPRPDAVYWSGDAKPGADLLAALRRKGYSGTVILSAQAEQAGFTAAAGPAGENVYTVVPGSAQNLPAAAAWAARFEKLYNRAPSRDAMLAYDAVRALGRSVTQTGTVDAARNSAELSRLDERFTTFLGPLRFAPDHTLKYGTDVVLALGNGGWTLKNTLRSHYASSDQGAEQ